MELGIIGLASSGKTTLFQALTKGRGEVVAHPSLAPSVGVVKVPDDRLAGLETLFHPQKTIPAEIKYSDVAAATSGEKAVGWSGQLLAHLSREDALIAVIRAFSDDRIPYPLRTEYRSPFAESAHGQGGQGNVDPLRDLGTIETELAYSDLAILERRLERLGISLKAAKPGEREGYLREQALLARVKAALEKEIPLREQSLSPEEARMLEGYQFLTAKPLLAAFNIGEAELPQVSSLEAQWRPASGGRKKPLFGLVALCAKLEMELAQLTEAEAKDFRSALGVAEPAVDRLVRLSYELLGLITFFTVVSAEVKAWTIRHGTPALKAAGKIHSDMERGFIRAEVVSYTDLMKAGSLAEARKHGLLRAEGKTYEVRDGDVITFLFNV